MWRARPKNHYHSRKAVGWEVYTQESGERAAKLIQRAVLAEQCWKKPLVLHSDDGAPMKSSTLLAKLYELGVTPSRGRPRMSNERAAYPRGTTRIGFRRRCHQEN